MTDLIHVRILCLPKVVYWYWYLDIDIAKEKCIESDFVAYMDVSWNLWLWLMH